MLATIRSRLRRAAQRGQVKRASAAYVVTDGIIRAAQGMRKQAQEPQNMPVPRAGNWRQYLPADPLLVATLQGKRLSGNTSRRVMDFGRKAWNTFQHMPVVGTKSPPTINDADVARLRYYQPPAARPAAPTGQLSAATPYLNRPARNPVPPAATKSPSRLWLDTMQGDGITQATRTGLRKQSAAPRVLPSADLPKFFKADKPNTSSWAPHFWEVNRPKYPTEKYLGTRELPFKPRPSASAPWQFHAPKTDEFGVPKFKLSLADRIKDWSLKDYDTAERVLESFNKIPSPPIIGKPLRLAKLMANVTVPAMSDRRFELHAREQAARDYVDWLTAQRQQK